MTRTSRSSCTTRSFRTTAALAAVTTFGLLATACGGSGGGDSTGTDTGGKPVTLTYWTWTLGAKSTVEAFNATHKDIKVEFTETVPGSRPSPRTRAPRLSCAANGVRQPCSSRRSSPCSPWSWRRPSATPCG
ncbi:hypothetical protein AB0C70_09970 [Streptomyces sp. NPDC048564]|uniref:hypothetical protein n=1 Tax=unclassified Streptomyces TaxID=2593676 RepID=UPI003435B421